MAREIVSMSHKKEKSSRESKNRIQSEKLENDFFNIQRKQRIPLVATISSSSKKQKLYFQMVIF